MKILFLKKFNDLSLSSGTWCTTAKRKTNQGKIKKATKFCEITVSQPKKAETFLQKQLKYPDTHFFQRSVVSLQCHLLIGFFKSEN